ncbi:MAG: flagellar hook-basal body complex protein [Clostridia bacterium]|nr:flagellar hook-basal body complex protein [Clostridia bacterium]
MMRSMFAAVSALRNHQTRMDVIGNNIANVNTVAFKSSRVTFQDVFYQTLSGGTAPSENQGGINPRQVGVGMAVNSIDTNFTQGNVEPTNFPTDVMIQGEGFFILSPDVDGTIKYYTRAGVFGFDAEGNLINKSNGMFVLDSSGKQIKIDDFSNVQSFKISSDGTVTYIDSSGAQQTAGQIGLAKFANNEGLIKVGENLYQFDINADTEDEDNLISAPGTGGRGTLVPGSLEMSNVDLAKEFTDMIITQRGYQANARTITTADEMLQELVNLKR